MSWAENSQPSSLQELLCGLGHYRQEVSATELWAGQGLGPVNGLPRAQELYLLLASFSVLLASH